LKQHLSRHVFELRPAHGNCNSAKIDDGVAEAVHPYDRRTDQSLDPIVAQPP